MWRTSIMYGVHPYCVVYINIVWHTSILCGVHQYCVVYINNVWRTSIPCGVHPYRVVYIHIVWRTSIPCGVHQCCVVYIHIVGIHQYCVAYINIVWCTSIFSGVQECDTWNSIAKVHARAGHSHEVVLEAFHKAAELAQTPQQKVRATMSAGYSPLMTSHSPARLVSTKPHCSAFGPFHQMQGRRRRRHAGRRDSPGCCWSTLKQMPLQAATVGVRMLLVIQTPLPLCPPQVKSH